MLPFFQEFPDQFIPLLLSDLPDESLLVHGLVGVEDLDSLLLLGGVLLVDVQSTHHLLPSDVADHQLEREVLGDLLVQVVRDDLLEELDQVLPFPLPLRLYEIQKLIKLYLPRVILIHRVYQPLHLLPSLCQPHRYQQLFQLLYPYTPIILLIQSLEVLLHIPSLLLVEVDEELPAVIPQPLPLPDLHQESLTSLMLLFSLYFSIFLSEGGGTIQLMSSFILLFLIILRTYQLLIQDRLSDYSSFISEFIILSYYYVIYWIIDRGLLLSRGIIQYLLLYWNQSRVILIYPLITSPSPSHIVIYIIMPDLTATAKNIIIGLMIITGAMNTLAYRYQNRQLVYEGAYYKLFFHPYMQATTMFVGEALCYLLFIIQIRRDPDAYKMKQLQAKSKGLQLKCNPLYIAIPAFCDFLTSTMQYIALNFISGSVWQMLRGGVIVTTAIFSKFFLKMVPKRNHYFGCLFAIIGILIVGASNIIFSPKNEDGDADAKLAILGYILVIASLFTNGFFFVFEEKLFQKYHLEPFQIVGIEGLWGLLFYGITLPIITFIPCNFGSSACVVSQSSFPYLERPEQYFIEAGQNGSLIAFIIIGIFSIALFNLCGVSVTKYINALARSLADVTRTVLIWLIGIIVTVTAGRYYPNYDWELTSAGAIIVQFVGFIVLVFGNLIYNKIIKIKIFMDEDQEIREALIQPSSTLGVSLQEQQNQEHDD